MKIKITRHPRCIWHVDCEHNADGIIKVMQHHDKFTSVVCLNCGEQGKILVGQPFEVCFDSEPIKECQTCYPAHCTDTSHGDCWCGPERENGLVIHRIAQ